jgi:hypothetical protein
MGRLYPIFSLLGPSILQPGASAHFTKMALLARFGSSAKPAASNPLADEDLACGGSSDDAIRADKAKKSPCEKCLADARNASAKATKKAGKGGEKSSEGQNRAADEPVVAMAVCRVRSHYLCKACLIMSVRSKIMKGLTHSAAYGHPLALAVSGGAASMSALHVAFQLLDCGRRRRGITGVVAAHVDASVLLPFHAHKYAGSSGEELFANTRRTVVRAALERGIPAVVLLPESAFADPTPPDGSCPSLPPFEQRAIGVFVEAPEVELPDLSGSGKGRAQFSLPPLTSGKDDRAALIDSAIESMETKLAEMKASCGASREQMMSFFAALKTLDARSRLYESVIERTLVIGTRELGCGHLALCDTVDRTAVKLITATCEGGGYSLPAMASPVDLRFAAPSTVVPLASAIPKEATPTSCGAEKNDLSTGLRVCSLEEARAGGIISEDSSHEGPLRTHDVPPSFPFHWYPALPPERPLDRKPVPIPSPLPDKANGGVVVIKPLHECEALEVALMARYCSEEIPTAFAPHPITMAPHRASIGQATEELLGTLQASFAATCHNITRTVRKVEPPSNESLLPTDVEVDRETRSSGSSSSSSTTAVDLFSGARGTPRCVLCANLLPAEGSDHDSLSRWAAESTGACDKGPDEVPAGRRHTTRLFCHPCHLMLRDGRQGSSAASLKAFLLGDGILPALPSHSVQQLKGEAEGVMPGKASAGRIVSREEMKEKLAEFLL